MKIVLTVPDADTNGWTKYEIDTFIRRLKSLVKESNQSEDMLDRFIDDYIDNDEYSSIDPIFGTSKTSKIFFTIE